MRTIKSDELKNILEKHELWLNNKKGGIRANLTGANLTGADLSGANLSHANLRYADLSRANLIGAYLSRANLTGANLIGANLTGANLNRANLIRANLSGANLSGAYLTGAYLSRANLNRANLSRTNFSGANLSGADLSGANFSGADFSGADLICADLSGAKNLLDPIEWLAELEHESGGIIAYKSFGVNYKTPEYWKIEAGAEITETPHPDPCLSCACGISVAKRGWFTKNHSADIWRVLIKWEWLPSVVVPYNTDGKFRCGRIKLIEKVCGSGGKE